MVDRHPMWKDLGMDLEAHDQLCEALPAAFGDVFLTQKMRPEGMAFWDMVAADVHGIRPAELVEEKKKGRKVFGTFCTYVPDEVVIACNGIVTGLCGGSEFWVPEGEKYLQNDVCPLVKASLGARMGRTCPFFRLVDEIVGETTCDGKKKMYEIMATDVPMHIMETPQMKRPQGHRLLGERDRRFRAERPGGNRRRAHGRKSRPRDRRDQRPSPGPRPRLRDAQEPRRHSHFGH